MSNPAEPILTLFQGDDSVRHPSQVAVGRGHGALLQGVLARGQVLRQGHQSQLAAQRERRSADAQKVISHLRAWASQVECCVKSNSLRIAIPYFGYSYLRPSRRRSRNRRFQIPKNNLNFLDLDQRVFKDQKGKNHTWFYVFRNHPNQWPIDPTLLRSPPAPEHRDLPIVAVQISPSKDGGKYEIVAKSPANALNKSPTKKTPSKQFKTPSKPLKSPTKLLATPQKQLKTPSKPLKTPTKDLKSPHKPPKAPLGEGDRGRGRRRVVLIPVERGSPLKSELQSNWEARHDINNLDNYSARIR